MEIRELIAYISDILQYFVPGYIFMAVFCFINMSEISERSHMVLLSVVISYVINSAVRIFIAGHTAVSVAISLVAAVLAGVIVSFVIKSNVFHSVLMKIGCRTINKNIFVDMLMCEDGCYVRLYGKDGKRIYEGDLFRLGEDYPEPWVALVNYKIYEIKDGELCDITDHTTPNKSVMVRMNDVERVEIYYGDDKRAVPDSFKIGDGWNEWKNNVMQKKKRI